MATLQIAHDLVQYINHEPREHWAEGAYLLHPLQTSDLLECCEFKHMRM